MKNNYDVIIVGGGAAGLAAAVALSRRVQNASVAVVEKESKPGRKLLATGNGRCNLTNMDMNESFYNESGRSFVKTVIDRVTPERLIGGFEKLGLVCRRDDALRVYPYANQSSAVLDILMMNAKSRGVEFICGTKVSGISHGKSGFTLDCGEKTLRAKRLILAAGGAVQKALGSDGSSYGFAKMLGLKCTNVFPSLAPIIVGDKDLASIKGVRTQAIVTAKCGEKTLAFERGELQFNEKNISGICVFQLSRFVNEHFAYKEKYKGIYISADLVPDFTEDEIFAFFDKKRRELPEMQACDILVGIINKKLGVYLCKKAGAAYSGRTVGELNDKELRALANVAKNCRFTPSQGSSFDSAQVTAGGISLDEIDRNMRVKKYDGLYAVGESLDVDGKCGGYNLHFAFSTGIIAGTDAAKSMRDRAK